MRWVGEGEVRTLIIEFAGVCRGCNLQNFRDCRIAESPEATKNRTGQKLQKTKCRITVQQFNGAAETSIKID